LLAGRGKKILTSDGTTKLNLFCISQNCQSLNISTKNCKTGKKLFALTKIGADIIFMSDIRLNAHVQTAAINNINKTLEFNGYNFNYNSPYASRGVSIAINKKLGAVITDRLTDRTGNILALKIELCDKKIALVSIYGPNDNNREFYADLTRILDGMSIGNDTEILIGGDWNSTWDFSDPEHNIDIFNMRNIPSRERSANVKRIADKFNLTETYRYMYPNGRDFTYIPNAVANNNRSRIDFFLASRDLMCNTKDTGIFTGKLSSLFDHKCIFLRVGKNKIAPDRNKISNGILSDPTVKLIVELSVKESYLNNADPDAVPRYTINTLKFEIGRINHMLKSAADIEYNAIITDTLNDPIRTEINNLINDSLNIAETLPGLEYFEQLPIITGPDIFFEGLIFAVKNDVLSKQSAIYKTKNFRKKVLRERIELLKKNTRENMDEILRQERLLDRLIEEELKIDLSKYKNFERLNQEKITPHFLNLARLDSSQNISLDSVCDDEEQEFQSNNERYEYVTQFYENLYKKPNIPEPGPDCVRAFLGDIADHPAVLESKLNENEKIDLDTDLTVEEFDKAVEQIKLNSSPGIDGISNKFIKTFWHLFRTPILNYAKHCLEAGTLTDSFKIAKIRLIPKKGNPKKISNWRPISLLNCFYKLISRVITNRLKRVSDKITLVGQKGYSNTKCCQEVLISLIDAISELKHTGKKGCIISLDIKKAFDSLSHKFMVESLKFFNFGNRIIKWITTICTNRKACVILSTGKLGRSFALERGNAQGDVISPIIFNICYQVLILKLELTLQINKVELPVPSTEGLEFVGAENRVSYRGKKVFAFADDCNILAALTDQNITNIVDILNDYGLISGLTCNVQKSNILLIGDNPAPTRGITESSLNLEEELTILGFTVNNRDSMINDNWNNIIEKINGLQRIWCRYNLSLPGRINVCKSMMLSQLNYKGCILPATDEHISKIETILYNFVCGNLRIAKDRVFLPVTQGGLGMIKIKDFLDAQTCSWIRRAKILDQDWKVKLIGTGSGNIYRINPTNLIAEKNPVLHNLARAFSVFVHKFTARDNNYKSSYIVQNPALTKGIRSRDLLTEHDLEALTEGNNMLTKNPLNLRMSDIFDGNNNIAKRDFELQLNCTVPVPINLWRSIDKVRTMAKTKYGRDEYKKTQTIESFFAAWKRGSKKIRNVLVPVYDFIPHNMVKFAENTETVINIDNSKFLNAFWAKQFLSNEVRVFIFKLHNNTLPVNVILSHFARDVGRNCSFCDLIRNPLEEPETVLHFFYNCEVSENIRVEFFKWITGDNNFSVTRREFFSGFKLHNNYQIEFLNVVTKFFKKYLWDCKLRKTLPALNDCKGYVEEEITTAISISKKFLTAYRSSGVPQIFTPLANNFYP
jgi:exonuclease III